MSDLEMPQGRPKPPEHLYTYDDDVPYDSYGRFAPAPEIWPWVQETFLYDMSPVYNPDHTHLIGQRGIEFLWADFPFQKQGKSVVGFAEQVMIRVGGWQKGRQERQLVDWFGYVPDFIVTLSAYYCSECSDTDFCALVEHELYHIAHAIDKETGALKFCRRTGLAKLEIRGHDVEEFIGVSRRYGASQQVRALVDAVNKGPELTTSIISHACGTCL